MTSESLFNFLFFFNTQMSSTQRPQMLQQGGIRNLKPRFHLIQVSTVLQYLNSNSQVTCLNSRHFWQKL